MTTNNLGDENKPAGKLNIPSGHPDPKFVKDLFDEKKIAALRAYAEQMGPEYVASTEHDLNRPLTPEDLEGFRSVEEVAEILNKSNKKARIWLVGMLVIMFSVIGFIIVKAIATAETEASEEETFSISEANPYQKKHGEASLELAEAMKVPESWPVRDKAELRMNGGKDDAYASYDASFTPPDELTIEEFEKWFNDLDRVKTSDDSTCTVERDHSYVECEASFTKKEGDGSINYEEPRQTIEIGFYPKREGSSDPGAVFVDIYSS